MGWRFSVGAGNFRKTVQKIIDTCIFFAVVDCERESFEKSDFVGAQYRLACTEGVLFVVCPCDREK